MPNDSLDAGWQHGQEWASNRAFRKNLEQLQSWASSVSGTTVTGQDVVSALYPEKVTDGFRHDAKKLLKGDETYALGFVEGAMRFFQDFQDREGK